MKQSQDLILQAANIHRTVPQRIFIKMTKQDKVTKPSALMHQQQMSVSICVVHYNLRVYLNTGHFAVDQICTLSLCGGL